MGKPPPFKRGDPLYASDLEKVSEQAFSSDRSIQQKPTRKIQVRNQSGADVDQWGVLGLTDPITTVAENQTAYEQTVDFDGVTPTSAHVGKFAVAQSPIASGDPDGDIGEAVMTGVTNAMLTILKPGDATAYKKADIDPDTGLLTMMPSGSAHVLWVDPSVTTSPRLGRVRLGNPTDPVFRWGITTAKLFPIVTETHHGDSTTTGEIQTIQLPFSLTSGTFTLSFDGSIFTSPLNWNVSNADLETALNGLSNAPPGGVTVYGSVFLTVQYNDPSFAPHPLIKATAFNFYPDLTQDGDLLRSSPVYWVHWGTLPFVAAGGGYPSNLLMGDYVNGPRDTNGIIIPAPTGAQQYGYIDGTDPNAGDLAGSLIGDLPQGAVVLCCEVDAKWEIIGPPELMYSRATYFLNNWYNSSGSVATSLIGSGTLTHGTPSMKAGSPNYMSTQYYNDVQAIPANYFQYPAWKVTRRGDYLVMLDVSVSLYNYNNMTGTSNPNEAYDAFTIGPTTHKIPNVGINGQILFQLDITNPTHSNPTTQTVYLANEYLYYFASGLAKEIRMSRVMSFNAGDLVMLSAVFTKGLPSMGFQLRQGTGGYWDHDQISFIRLGQPQGIPVT